MTCDGLCGARLVATQPCAIGWGRSLREITAEITAADVRISHTGVRQALAGEIRP